MLDLTGGNGKWRGERERERALGVPGLYEASVLSIGFCNSLKITPYKKSNGKLPVI